MFEQVQKIPGFPRCNEAKGASGKRHAGVDPASPTRSVRSPVGRSRVKRGMTRIFIGSLVLQQHTARRRTCINFSILWMEAAQVNHSKVISYITFLEILELARST